LSSALKSVCTDVADRLRQAANRYAIDADLTDEWFVSEVLQQAARLHGAAEVTPDEPPRFLSQSALTPGRYQFGSGKDGAPHAHGEEESLGPLAELARRQADAVGRAARMQEQGDGDAVWVVCEGGSADGTTVPRSPRMPAGAYCEVAGCRYRLSADGRSLTYDPPAAQPAQGGLAENPPPMVA
jgi:hypothetical protein